MYTGGRKVEKKRQDYVLERLSDMRLISDVESARFIDLEKWKLGRAVLRKKGAPCLTSISSLSHIYYIARTSIY